MGKRREKVVHELAVPLRGNTHAWVLRLSEDTGSNVAVLYRPGTVGDDGFIPDPLIPEVRRAIAGPELRLFYDEVRKQRAPVTAGKQEYRLADVLAWLDSHGWEPLTHAQLAALARAA